MIQALRRAVLRNLAGRNRYKPRLSPQLIRSAVATYGRYLDEGRLPSEHPWIVHVETRSLCNSRCAFCAAASNNPGRPPDTLMPEALFDKILDELSQIGYANRLSLYNNNEPFLDKRIFSLVGRARAKVPRALLELKSNGVGLTLDRVLKIFESGLDVLYVNDYVSDGVPSKHIEMLCEQLGRLPRFGGHHERGRYTSSRISIATRHVGEVLSSRAGTAPNHPALSEPLAAPCFRPFEMMTVHSSGSVAACSDDVYFREPMGNLNEQSLMEIWHSPKYREMRRRLLGGRRGDYAATCRGCDNQSPKIEMMIAAGVPIPRPSTVEMVATAFRSGMGRVLRLRGA